MRSNTERVASVERRARELRRLRARRLSRIAAACGTCASLVIIIALSLAMPRLGAGGSEADYALPGAASIFGGGAAAGYVVIGAIAFTLGVCVTVLCFKLRAGAGRDAEDRDDRDNR